MTYGYKAFRKTEKKFKLSKTLTKLLYKLLSL